MVLSVSMVRYVFRGVWTAHIPDFRLGMGPSRAVHGSLNCALRPAGLAVAPLLGFDCPRMGAMECCGYRWGFQLGATWYIGKFFVLIPLNIAGCLH